MKVFFIARQMAVFRVLLAAFFSQSLFFLRFVLPFFLLSPIVLKIGLKYSVGRICDFR